MRVAELLESHDHVLATFELRALGCSPHELRRAVHRGEVIRPRQGWYCSAQLDPLVVQALRVGGRLGCTSAARHHGLWVRGVRLHVDVPPGSARLRHPDNPRHRMGRRRVPLLHVHWGDSGDGGDRVAVDVLSALMGMAMCESPELVIAAADSALRRRLITDAGWSAAIESLPRRLRRLLSRVDPKSESITESVSRCRLHALGIRTRRQVKILGVGFVDLLIGDALVIELDGREWHDDEARFEKDRRRDALLSIRGYRVLRFSYKQVFERWSEVRAAIEASIGRNDHRRAS
jgi:very-short-patch-repair endonuclease